MMDFGCFQSLKLLSVMAAIRLDNDGADNIETTLSVALVDSTNGAVKDRSLMTVDPLASSTWEQVTLCCCKFLLCSLDSFQCSDLL